MVDLHPKTCNLCGGKVILCSNARVYYGRTYGSGLCYYCLACGAYVGTHEPRPQEALGLLADEAMRKGKKLCHDLFDPLWRGKEHAGQERRKAYRWLAGEMGIDIKDCHFGYFDIHQLRQAYRILKERCSVPPC